MGDDDKKQNWDDWPESQRRPWFVTLGSLTDKKQHFMPLIPEHRVYTEPFLGRGELVFYKAPAEEEHLTDIDPTIVALHTFAKSYSDDTLKRLMAMQWTGSRATYDAMKKASPKIGSLEWVHRQLYLRGFGMGSKREGNHSYRPSDDGRVMKPWNRLAYAHARVKDCKIRKEDFRETVNGLDYKDAFHFFDPPYFDAGGDASERYYDEGGPPPKDYLDVMTGMKGKSMLVTTGNPTTMKVLTDKLFSKRFKWAMQAQIINPHVRNAGTRSHRAGWIITNYPGTGLHKSLSVQVPIDLTKVSDLTVDDLGPGLLRQVKDDDLKALNDRLHEIFDDHFDGTTEQKAEGVTRNDLANSALYLWEEMTTRKLNPRMEGGLAEEVIDLAGALPRNKALDPDGDLAKALDSAATTIVLAAPVVTIADGVSKGLDVYLDGFPSPALARAVRQALTATLADVTKDLTFVDGAPTGGAGGAYANAYDLALTPRDDRGTIVQASDGVAKAKADAVQVQQGKGGPVDASLQLHAVGKAVHLDLRFVVVGKDGKPDHSIGWTLFAVREGKAPNVETVVGAKDVFEGWTPADGNDMLKPLLDPARMACAPKDEAGDLAIVSTDSRTYKPGDEGAGLKTPGVMATVARLKAEWGVQEPQFHEYFLTGPGINGPLYMRQIGTGGEARWICHLSEGTLPTVLKPASVQRGTMPPLGVSALPASLEAAVPPAFRYWEAKTEAEAEQVRADLVSEGVFTDNNVRIVDGQFRLVTSKLYLFKLDDFVTERDQAFVDYYATVNMTDGELEGWADTPLSRKADRSTIGDSLRLLSKKGDVAYWTPRDVTAARRAVAFIKRTLAAPQGAPVADGAPSQRDILLMNWGHDVRKAAGQGSTLDVVKADQGDIEAFLARYTDSLRIVKADRPKAEQFAMCVVLEPNDGKDGAPLDPDAQKDIYSAADIRQTAHLYIQRYRNIGFIHRKLINGKALISESFIAPVGFWSSDGGDMFTEEQGRAMKGKYKGGDLQYVRKGSWLLGLQFKDKALWNDVEDDKLTGLSIGGDAKRTPAKV